MYTALQAGILDGAENNELALTDNGHGDICKYYSYDMHQMVPDLLVANYAFLNELSDEERAIFEEGFQIVKRTEQDAWEDAVAEAKDKAENEQHVNLFTRTLHRFRSYGPPARFRAGSKPGTAAHL